MIQTLLIGFMSYVYYYTVPEGQGKHSYSWYCIHRNNGLKNSYHQIPHFVCNIEALIPQDLCFSIAYKPRELVNDYYHCDHDLIFNSLTLSC